MRERLGGYATLVTAGGRGSVGVIDSGAVAVRLERA